MRLALSQATPDADTAAVTDTADVSIVRGAPVAVVTGAARGLGFEIVRLLSRRGYLVVAADVDLQTVRGAHDGDDRVRPVGLDVRDADACVALAASAAEEHGRLD